MPLLVNGPHMPTPKPCPVLVDGKPCGKPIRAKGKCVAHYQAERRQQAKANVKPDAPPNKQLERRRSAKYSDQEIEAAFLAAIMNGGNAKRASELTGINHGTIKDWMRMYPARYSELRREKGPELERLAVDQLMQFVTAAEEVKMTALRKTQEQLEADDAKDPGAVLRNVATAQGISVTKVMELTGRPTSTNPSGRSAQELLAALARLGAIAGTAEELPPAPALHSGDTETVAATADSTEGITH